MTKFRVGAGAVTALLVAVVLAALAAGPTISGRLREGIVILALAFLLFLIVKVIWWDLRQ